MILLIAVGRDSNDHYLPITFGVVNNETKDTWNWFVKLTLEDSRWCFIYDQQKVCILVNVYNFILHFC